MEGRPGPLDSVEDEGETIGVQAIERAEGTGEVTKFLIRKSMKKTKESLPGAGFEETNVCNPCGLWFNKFRNMRPEEKWHRKPNPRKRKSKTDDGFATDGVEPASEAFFTDQIVPEDAVEENSTDDSQAEQGAAESDMPAPARRPRANSLQDQSLRRGSDGGRNRAAAAATTARETQSSPVLNGSQQSPIELDLTPKPTRRLLFPSPRQSGEVKSLDEETSRSEKSGKKTGSLSPGFTSGQNNVDVYKFAVDKENMAPPIIEHDDLSHLFEGSPFKTPLPKTPSKKTPSSQRRAGDMLLRTPTQSSRRRKALTPNQNAANNADMNPHPNDFLTSPSSARYFLRSTPSRLERTPGGRSAHSRGLNGEPSPFSRHLAQMLNEATDGGVFTSPSRQFDFSDLPTFTTPGREVDWKGLDDMLSSEFANYDETAFEGGQQQPGGEQ